MHIDMPTLAQVRELAGQRHAASVTITLPTTPVTPKARRDRIRFGNLAKEALEQLREAQHAPATLAALEEQLASVEDDVAYWDVQARGLVVFATPDKLLTFRLPNRLTDAVEVSDRFDLPPLLRALTFPHEAVALLLGQNGVRVLSIGREGATVELTVPDMPKDASSVASRANLRDRSPKGRTQGSEGHKVMLRSYARRVDQALRSVLASARLPLAVVAAEPLRSIFHGVSSHDDVLTGELPGLHEGSPETEVAAGVRALLDARYAEELAVLRERFGDRQARGMATANTAAVAQAVTFGTVSTLLVDMDASLPGLIDPTDGTLVVDADAGASSYNVFGEMCCRALLTGARVVSARASDIPEGAPVAAFLRAPL